ncbi:MAG: glutamine synthetase, partial [Candidatus Omnitrophica bacterium]|nr:glutamine synthetase [Candidatus Omnitrophota bacterium]
QNNVYATFMPKPIFGMNGSGMHTHMSLFKGTRNAFFDKNDKYHISKIAKNFIAGLMEHAQEITSITNQWVNSYKRLVPGYEAPAYISWASRNRSDLIRIPMYKPGREKATRVEYRAPDPACNPYLAFSIMLAAGLEGMKKGYKLKTPIERNVYEIGEEERKKLGIDTLPGDLYEAVLLTSKSKLVKETLGDHVFNKFLENKKIEWNNYRAQVTSYEMDRYYSIL